MNDILIIGSIISLLLGFVLAIIKEKRVKEQKTDFISFHNNLQKNLELSITKTLDPLIQKLEDIGELEDLPVKETSFMNPFYEIDDLLSQLRFLQAGVYSVEPSEKKLILSLQKEVRYQIKSGMITYSKRYSQPYTVFQN